MSISFKPMNFSLSKNSQTRFFERSIFPGLFPLGVFSENSLPCFQPISTPYTIPILEEILLKSMGVFLEIFKILIKIKFSIKF
jgi:hypothetical protein